MTTVQSDVSQKVFNLQYEQLQVISLKKLELANVLYIYLIIE